MLHGLRDCAWSLLPIAHALASSGDAHEGYRVVIPELRGHGSSDHSEAYAMSHFLMDLHQVIEHFTAGDCALFGHSLGGHIVTRYAALFPEAIRAMLVVEGLGPPARPYEGDPAAEVRAYREMLLTRLGERSAQARPIKDLADVAARLLRNNPRLSPALADTIAPHMVRPLGQHLTWSFDARANSVFIGTSTHDNVRFWQQVQAPTCIISGTLSHEYWGRELASDGFTGHFAPGEMESRAQQFCHHTHHWFEQSGHMVHYDEPQRLADVSRQFLEQHYV